VEDKQRRGAGVTVSDYLATFVSIIVGLALADLAGSLHRLLRAGPRVIWDWLTPLAALNVAFAIQSVWWATFNGLVHTQSVTFAEFTPRVFSTMLLFLLASAALPDEVPQEGLNLRRYYDDNRRYFWALYALWVGSILARRIGEAFVDGHPPADIAWLVGGNAAVIPPMIALMFVRSRLAHGAFLVLLLSITLVSWFSDRVGG